MALAEHLEKLRYFHKLCAFPSLQAAARSMGISQAGLSKSIHSLEDAVGTRLFVRSAKGMTLTASGKLLLETSDRILSEALAFDAKAVGIHLRKIPKAVRFGMYDSIAVYFYSNLSTYIRHVYPKVTLHLNVEGSRNLLQKFSKGAIDIALGVNFQSFADGKSRYLPLWNDEYSFFVSQNSQLDPEDAPLIYFPDASDGQGKTQDEHLKSLFKSRSLIRVHNFETVKSLTQSGLGIGVLPNQVAKPLLKQNLIQPATISRFRRSFGSHSIGLLVSKNLVREHEEFVQDLYRLGLSWAQL